jgi:hypothetical protein
MFLAYDASVGITGEVVYVDCGYKTSWGSENRPRFRFSVRIEHPNQKRSMPMTSGLEL